MQIKTEQTASGHDIKVNGIIKTIEDSSNFKNAITSILEKSPTAKISVHILDSYIITSSIIGTLLKLVQKDRADITLYAYQDDLMELVEKLNLTNLINLKKAR